jgi:hypothetical protein
MQKTVKINEASSPDFIFCSLRNRALLVHNKNGTVVANITVPISGNTMLVSADTDSTGAYICVTANDHRVYVYKRNSPTSYSWSLSRIYGI